MKSDVENFFEDFLRLLIERAIEARDRRKGIGIDISEEKGYEEGRAQAYYQVLSNFINMAHTFDLTSESIPGLNFDADKELLR